MGFFRSANIVSRADKISNFTVSTAEYGSAVMEVLGTTRISGNVIYYDDFTAHEHRETQRSGKGGGVKSTTITYTYTAAVIMGLCEGPVRGIDRVWIDKELYQYPSDKIGMTLYKGTADQQPWPYVVGKHPKKALPYTGLAYMAGVIDLGNNANLPNFNFEVQGKLTETGDGVDVNPADYIRYILDKIGLQDVEIAGLDNYRQYCQEADFLISTPSDYTSAKTARDIVNEIVSLTNAYMFWSNDRFKIIPKADRAVGRWKPNKQIVYDLTADDFLEQSNGACVTYARKDSSEIYNRFTVEFYNRANAYEKESVSYEDSEDIADYGLRQASTTAAHYIYTKKRAVMLAEELARRNKYERNKYTFKLDWAFCRLEPGDLVTLTDNNIGLNKQVAIIDSVTEDAKGILTFTAISRAAGDYSEALYDVHEIDRPYIDFNADSGNIDTPLIFQPPSDLTSNGNELWVAAKGKKDTWGGCAVYVSDNNVNYRRLGTITNNARLGALARTMKADDAACEVKINGTLISGSDQDAERGNTLCWVDGECISYVTATMLDNGNYLLEGCKRGQYNTEATTHSSGARFVRCDEALLKSEVRKEDVGKKVWLKFCSYNVFNSGEQSLADVQAYVYTITDYYIPPVRGLSAYNRYRHLKDGVARYDVVAQWTPPEMASYLEGQLWYKTSSEQAERMVMTEGVAADEMGWQGEWLYGGSGKDQCVIPQAIVGDTYRIAVCTKDEYGAATSPDLSPQFDITVASKTTTPNTPDGFGVEFGTTAVASWQGVTNTDIAFYEVRRDTNPGVEDGNMLARTDGLNTVITITERSGWLYLYAKNRTGQYSLPNALKYSKAAPPKPEPPSLTPKLGGIGIRCKPAPAGCVGVRFYISGSLTDSIYDTNNAVSYLCDAGVYDVTCAYVDMFGEGPVSEKSTCTVKVIIDQDMIADEAINAAKLDKIVQGNIKQATEDALQALRDAQTNAGDLQKLSESVYSRVETDKLVSDSITNFKDGTLKDYSTTKQTESMINSMVAKYTDGKLEGYSTTKQTSDMISSSITNFKDGTLKDYSTTKQTESMINSMVAKYTDGKLEGYSTTKQTSDMISSSITNFKDGTLKDYSTITQMNNAISLAVSNIDLDGNTLISKINLANGSILLDGKLIHVTGQTLFEDNVITKKMLQAGSVSAEKLAAEDINLTGALAIVGGTTRLSEEGLRITDADGGCILYNAEGMNYYDDSGNRYAQVKRTIIGSAAHGQHVKFAKAWRNPPLVLCSPLNAQITQSAYQQAALKLVCRAANVTTEGFDVQCYTTLMGGESSSGAQTQAISGGDAVEMAVTVTNTATSVSIPVTVSLSAIKGKGTFKYYYKNNYGNWETNGQTATGDTWFNNVYATVSLIVNGAQKAQWRSSSFSSSSGSNSVNEFTTMNATFSAGSAIKIRVALNYGIAHNMSGNGYYQWRYTGGVAPPSGTITVSSKYSVSGETVISTGSAFFLVLDANSSAYTVD